MDFDIEKFSYRLTVLLDENNMTQTQLVKKRNKFRPLRTLQFRVLFIF